MNDLTTTLGLSGAGGASQALDAGQLCRRCDPATLPFETVAELDPPTGILGQDRAVEAISLAIQMRRKGYNLFVYGPAGTGRHSRVTELVRAHAATEPVPSDWCYVNNFTDPQRPKALRLPPGRATGLRDAMNRLVQDLRVALPAAFQREEYRARRDALDQELKARHEQAFGELQQRAEKKGLALLRTPVGLAVAPVRNGEVIPPEIFKRLPEAEREEIRANIAETEQELTALMRKTPEWEQEHREALRRLNRETTASAVGHLIGAIRAGYADLPEVLAYLDEVERDLQENANDFLMAEEAGNQLPFKAPAELSGFRRYQVNALVDHASSRGAPVVSEDHPTHQRLVGRTEHIARFGTLVTDFNLIAAGALHAANGGYLILDAEKVLRAPFGWDTLKRALRSGEIRIQSLEQLLSVATTVSLDPEPIPLDVKVILIGPPLLYHLLAEFDTEFQQLFKIAAEFDDRVDRNDGNIVEFARLLGALVRERKLRPPDRGAVARLVDYVSRLAGDSEKLATRVREVVELLEEADHRAGRNGKDIVSVEEVQETIDARIRRADRLYQRLQEEIRRNTLRIETSGERIGQVNGLSVHTFGGFSFGLPTRITARVRLGEGQVIDIEREVRLGGPFHSKGILILTGFLAGRYGRQRPLALTASLVFEQSYGVVDGDSASAAELFALLSALAEIPITQSLAVTGSVDQLGNIQAIGGVNEKIEGFFDTCRNAGLSGKEGVLIPAANVKHLMLRDEVVEAAREGKFRIYPVSTVDQGIELLTGIPAGAPDLTGNYPQGTVNYRIATRLARFEAKALARRTRERRARRGMDHA
jgi:lon-related putative ATP-dependent protease